MRTAFFTLGEIILFQPKLRVNNTSHHPHGGFLYILDRESPKDAARQGAVPLTLFFLVLGN